jgi:hypothetical protein
MGESTKPMGVIPPYLVRIRVLLIKSPDNFSYLRELYFAIPPFFLDLLFGGVDQFDTGRIGSSRGSGIEVPLEIEIAWLAGYGQVVEILWVPALLQHEILRNNVVHLPEFVVMGVLQQIETTVLAFEVRVKCNCCVVS